MPYSDLQEFVEALDRAGELRRVTPEVSPILEVTEITDRVSKSACARASEHAAAFDAGHAGLGGHALLFENVAGASMPLGMNLYGSYRRMEMAFGCEDVGFEGVAAKIGALVKPEPPTTIWGKVKKGLELAKIASLPPKVVRSGRCQEVVKQGGEIDLFELPVIKCWPGDGDPTSCGYPWSAERSGTAKGQGRYITLSGVYTIHPDDAGKAEGKPRPSRNIGMYRAQLIDRDHCAMHWHVHHDGARHWRAWQAHNRRLGQPEAGMPAAIVLGGESVLPYAATAPLPPGVSELLMAGCLNGGSIPLVRCRTIDMHVPANAEIVIEGYVSTEAGPIGFDPRVKGPDGREPELGPGAVFEGPFGDHTGFYSLPDRYPVFTVTAVTHRRSPIYPATIVGLPPQEDYYLGKATERLFLPLLKILVPDIEDYHLPMFGAFHNCAFVKIRKSYPLQARRVMHAIWGAGQMAWTKSIVVVDETVDVHDEQAVLFHIAANCDPGRDLEIVNGPLDILDHAAPRLGAGHKIGFDATKKWPGEECGGHAVRSFPPILEMQEDVRRRVTERWGELGL
ncbi:UbiD family decarboxylase [Mucisphaera calidilacus]|uniref:3-octaprenyl-4-hydroxybenzoate carboxy-lyase n=1 Tax=Mucisphaera calidilacus TaxID=2527982 RepID=A0A518BXD6_9BACT|nr:UbiD family decarboxylase domain-containing protein [Mucisphaera calidilacus]QDU71642.1 3-octaprenyl-4-hydroxybenzoate carboxy-lyase [Mucisphaera calidilacus]